MQPPDLVWDLIAQRATALLAGFAAGELDLAEAGELAEAVLGARVVVLATQLLEARDPAEAAERALQLAILLAQGAGGPALPVPLPASR